MSAFSGLTKENAIAKEPYAKYLASFENAQHEICYCAFMDARTAKNWLNFQSPFAYYGTQKLEKIG